MTRLKWPDERTRRDEIPAFAHYGSNVWLDFPGP